MTTALTFNYRARNSSGKVVKGTVEAASQAAAIAKVNSLGISPIEVKQGGGALQMEISIPGLSGRVKKQDLAISFRQMATMISAGLPLVTTLVIIAEQTEVKPLKKAFTQVRSDIEQGRGFSDSLAKHDVFPALSINLIRAGEVGGFLDKSLDSVALNLEKDVKLTGAIKGAMTMPLIVMGVAAVAIVGMLLFVVPTFQTMFEDLGSELPLPTQILVGLSSAMPIALPIIIVAIIAFNIWWRRAKRKDSIRSKIDPLKLKMPVFGTLTTKIAIARFARNFAQMTAAGVPILRSLQIVGETSGNWVIENAMNRVADSVRSGGAIAAPLAQEKAFPPMVVQMIAVGENAGAMETMLNKIADFYDEQVEEETKSLAAALEPIMTSVLGVIVGFMVIALYMPMFNLMGEIGGG